MAVLPCRGPAIVAFGYFLTNKPVTGLDYTGESGGVNLFGFEP